MESHIISKLQIFIMFLQNHEKQQIIKYLLKIVKYSRALWQQAVNETGEATLNKRLIKY